MRKVLVLMVAAVAVGCGSSGESIVDVGPPLTPTPTNDAGIDASDAAAESPTDAGSDAPVGECTASTERCHQYQHQTCSSGAWAKVNDESCCKDTARFTIVDSLTLKDTLTGKKWERKGNWANPANWDNFGCGTGRKATTTEMLALVIGVGTCTPALDQQAFTLTTDTEYRGEGGGCVDMTTGTSKTTCATSTVGYLCVVD